MQSQRLHTGQLHRQQAAGRRAGAAPARAWQRGSSAAAAAAARPRRVRLRCRAERREYYDIKDMPPLPLTVSRISVPALGYTVVDTATKQQRPASLAIFYDIHSDDQYQAKLNRRSAITALCMFDQDDVAEARRTPGDFPNIDLLLRIYNEGLELDFVVE